jgi:hypothetical protein
MPWRTAAEMHHYPDMGLRVEPPMGTGGYSLIRPMESTPSKWMRKFAEHKRGIALIFASTDTKGFHEHVFASGCTIYFLKGRTDNGSRTHGLERQAAFGATSVDLHWCGNASTLTAVVCGEACVRFEWTGLR